MLYPPGPSILICGGVEINKALLYLKGLPQHPEKLLGSYVSWMLLGLIVHVDFCDTFFKDIWKKIKRRRPVLVLFSSNFLTSLPWRQCFLQYLETI